MPFDSNRMEALLCYETLENEVFVLVPVLSTVSSDVASGYAAPSLLYNSARPSVSLGKVAA